MSETLSAPARIAPARPRIGGAISETAPLYRLDKTYRFLISSV